MNLDVLVFAAHPDDAELAMGGTIAKFSKNDFKVGIIDLTRGELGTRGTPESRQQEAFNAAIILKVAVRENLEIPDQVAHDPHALDAAQENASPGLIEMSGSQEQITESKNKVESDL